MIDVGFYVRCPIDREFPQDPRVFATGRVVSLDEFNETACIKFLDPFGYRQYFDFVPQEISEVPVQILDHCSIFVGSLVKVGSRIAKILEYKGSSNTEYEYYVQFDDTKEYGCIKESAISAAFLSGRAHPLQQLKRYEFHNPCWYLGRQIVKGTISILENSIFGFKELAGCKIYLKAFQLNTIMQCLNSEGCRYMIADEVGLGKTIEACSILKIFLSNKTKMKILISMPEALLSQWKTELLFKFGLFEGVNENKNVIELIPVEKLHESAYKAKWDFVIVDEVHNYVADEQLYHLVHSVSRNCTNIILLSATPIQQRSQEYLKLLRLVLPDKYDSMSNEQFLSLVEKQNKIARQTHMLLDEIDTLKTEVIPESKCENIHEDEDVIEVIDEIRGYVDALGSVIEDNTLLKMIENVDYDSDDLGIYDVQVIISYICDNYQIERNIIRGRRSVLGVYPKVKDGEFAERRLVELVYSIDENVLFYEYEAYRKLVDWILSIQNELTDISFKNSFQPILESFFSSPWAYVSMLNKNKSQIAIPEEVLSSAARWVEDEDEAITCLPDILDDMDNHPSRMIRLVNYIDTELFGKKIVVFTDFDETFRKYYDVLSEAFGEEVTRFSVGLDLDEAECNIYRFQTDPDCKVLVCDKSGGEGRNLQIADYVIHVDLPWNIVNVEQRIGRLDRMGRNVEIPVTSVVIHSTDSYEEQLFNLWNQGLNVFQQSLSGIEIIMNEVNAKIVQAMLDDFEMGLYRLVPDLIKEAETMREVVRKEQLFDTAALRYRPLYIQLNALLNNYQFNENSLFAETMMSWASLAGFGQVTHYQNDSVVSFSKQSFSVRAAQNSYLIPPNWENYLTKKQNELSIRVVRKSEEGKMDPDNTIRGTFDRDLAIKNDYVHFYAPGDEIFDCITENALHSYRGMCTAFAAQSSVEWKGFVYTYSVEPNIKLLLDAGVPLLMLGLFKQYLGKTIKTILIPFSQYADVPEKSVINEHRRLCKVGYFSRIDSLDHLGRRSSFAGGFLSIPARYKSSNLEWFKGVYRDKWETLVDKSYALSKKKVKELNARETNCVAAKEIIEQILSANESRLRYFGMKNDESLEVLRKQYDVIYQSIENPQFRLESVCYMWLKK